MATTLISDIIIPELWAPYVIQRTAEKSRFIQSGIIQADPQFDALVGAASGGSTVNMPFWNDLAGDSQVLDDSTPLITKKMTSSQDLAAIQNRGDAWKHNDLAGLLAGSDPAKAAADLVADYWNRDRQKLLIASLKGVFAAASMATNLHQIYVNAGVPGEANVINGRTFLDAQQVMGDSKETLAAIAMHSQTETALAKQNLIAYQMDSEGQPTIKTFMGRPVIVDDGLPVRAVGDANVFTTYLFGRGAFGLGTDNVSLNQQAEGGFGTKAVEFFREALAGNSGLINRQRFILHPRGVKWTSTVQAKITGPTNAELANGSNWTRVFESKNVRIVAFEHNIAAAA